MLGSLLIKLGRLNCLHRFITQDKTTSAYYYTSYIEIPPTNYELIFTGFRFFLILFSIPTKWLKQELDM